MLRSQNLLDVMVERLAIKGLETLSPDEFIHLEYFTPEEFIQFVEDSQTSLVKEFGLPDIQVSRLDYNVLKSLLARMEDGKGIQLTFRHGEQDPGPEISALTDEALKKIIMMQKKHNETDPITISSAVDFMATLLTNSYLKARTQYKVKVEHSPNVRAKQPAETLARTLDAPITESLALKCVNYKENVDSSQLDAKGNLPWIKRNVDVVVGDGVYEQVQADMQARLAKPLEAKTLEVVVTHTQQIDELVAQASKGAAPAKRLSNYGFIYRDSDTTETFENGFYSKEKLVLTAKIEEKSAACASADGFFSKTAPSFANVEAFKTGSLASYLSQITSFSTIWEGLGEQFEKHSLFQGKAPRLYNEAGEPIDYNMNVFLADYFKSSIPNLDKTAFDLLSEPLKPVVDAADGPHDLGPLSDALECYIDLLCDVRRNKHAKKPYDKSQGKLQENVDEENHGNQAAKIATHVGMLSEAVLTMQFHDIARPSNDVSDAEAHANHCHEGSDILAPLGLELDYSRYHAVAKYLLYHFCPSYKDLISPLSQESLRIQERDFIRELRELHAFDPARLAKTMYQIMFMRLIDDMSKVPTPELKAHLGHDPEYYRDETIRHMLRKQITKNLQACTSSPTEAKEKLDAAIRLMIRVKSEDCHDPNLYAKHAKVIDPLRDAAAYVAAACA